MKWAAFLGVLLLLAAGGWRLLAQRAARDEGKVRVPTAEATRGTLLITLPVTGALESAEETPVRTELAGTLVQLCEDNLAVKPGDFVYQLDTRDLIDQRTERERALTDAQEALTSGETDAQTNTTQTENDAISAQESLKLTQEQARAQRAKIDAQVKFAEGQVARASRELARSERLAKLNWIAGTKLREAQRSFRSQQFDLDQQRAQQADVKKKTDEQIQDQQAAVDLAAHALTTAKANAESNLTNNHIRVDNAKRLLEEVEQKIVQCTVNSPAAGLAVIETNTENWPERRPYRVGDQVGAGMAPVRVYDFTRMQVRCQIGEMDISRVHQGQQARVSSSGQPGRHYRGAVAVVEELARDSNVFQGGTPGKKVFGLLVKLAEADPAHLRPGMTVDLEIVLDDVREATMVPIRAIFREGKRSLVYVARGEGFAPVPVTVGRRNDLLVEVSGKVRAGDRVALERPLNRVSTRAEEQP